ncbi:YisL family protein [Halalkalibacillus halophilus]|uniref:YisL family protein n=1 Tax=Halalkalibacillus halophilus TaxID=392827 RepID=UPI00041E98DB|nr:YisL family protein [Halalkalibacillus halophilus]
MDHQSMALLHIFSWGTALILFIVAYVMITKGKAAKPIKIIQMILRVFFVLIIATGADLFFQLYFGVQGGYFAESIIKIITGVWVIGAMEMTLAMKKKGKKVFIGWIQFAVAMILVLILGFARLPYGFLP